MADHWIPPVITGGPTPANFCLALTAIYRHMADLPRIVSKPVTEQYLSDYTSFAPTVVENAPAQIRASTTAYLSAVSTYLQRFVAAGLSLQHLPAGSLGQLASAEVNDAYSALSAYSTGTCHYTIGGASNG